MENESKESVTYGVHAVAELVKNHPTAVENVLLAREPSLPELRDLLKTCRKQRIPVQRVPPGRLAVITRTDKHQGVAAIGSARPYNTVDEMSETLASVSAPLVMVPASVEDPRNLGALVRSGAAFGVNAFLLEHKHTSPLSGLVAKTAAGMLDRVLVVKPRSLEATVMDLRSSGYAVVGADAAGEQRIEQIDLTGPLVWVLGGEHRGIPPYLRKLCTSLVRIPIDPHVPSLNVSVAGAVVLYETARQRGFPCANASPSP